MGHPMARIVGRKQIREGRGLGERLTEVIVWIAIIAGIIYGARWYFTVYLVSPRTILSKYLGYVKAGNPEAQYGYLANSTKGILPTQAAFEKEWKGARGFAGRISDYSITSITETGSDAKLTVSVGVTKPGQELYQAAADSFKDVYVMRKEASGWRVVLEKSTVRSLAAAGTQP